MTAPSPLAQDTRQSLRRRRIVSIISLLIMIAVFAVVTIYVGLPLVRKFEEDPETFRDFVSSHGLAGRLLMIGIVMLQVLVAVIPGEPFEVAAGFVFGWIEGTLLFLVGTAIAGALILLAVRKWGIRLVEAFFSPEKINRYSFMKSSKKLNLLMFILFLIPGTPKDLLNYVAGLTPMKVCTFVGITTLARIPSVLSATVSGHLAQQQEWTAALITYGITALISIACILWYRKVSRDEKQQKEQSPA